MDLLFLRHEYASEITYGLVEVAQVGGMTRQEAYHHLKRLAREGHLFDLPRNEVYWHSAILFWDGIAGTSEPVHGVCLKRIHNLSHYDKLTVSVSPDRENGIRRWFGEHGCDAFNWAGYLRNEHVLGREFCCEACIEAMHKEQMMLDVTEPWTVHATRFAVLAVQEFGGELQPYFKETQ